MNKIALFIILKLCLLSLICCKNGNSQIDTNKAKEVEKVLVIEIARLAYESGNFGIGKSTVTVVNTTQYDLEVSVLDLTISPWLSLGDKVAIVFLNYGKTSCISVLVEAWSPSDSVKFQGTCSKLFGVVDHDRESSEVWIVTNNDLQ